MLSEAELVWGLVDGSAFDTWTQGTRSGASSSVPHRTGSNCNLEEYGGDGKHVSWNEMGRMRNYQLLININPVASQYLAFIQLSQYPDGNGVVCCCHV